MVRFQHKNNLPRFQEKILVWYFGLKSNVSLIHPYTPVFVAPPSNITFSISTLVTSFFFSVVYHCLLLCLCVLKQVRNSWRGKPLLVFHLFHTLPTYFSYLFLPPVFQWEVLNSICHCFPSMFLSVRWVTFTSGSCRREFGRCCLRRHKFINSFGCQPLFPLQ